MTRILLGALLGVLAWGAVRFVAQPWPQPPHYHANWTVFIDGVRLDLSADRYMESVEACAAAEEVLPEQRVHMHANEDGVVHVHDHGVAWGHFLENLGFDAGADYLILDDGRRFFNTAESSLKYVANGLVLEDISPRRILPGDRVLISYGPESAEQALQAQFPRVPANAAEYDERQDPGGCAGIVELSFGERLRRAFWRSE